MTDRPGGFAADLDALAALGWGPDRLDSLSKFEPGVFADFRALDPEARALVVAVLAGEATDADHQAFDARADSQAIAEWMLRLPAFQGDDFEDDE